jgi:hypothetical protein
MTKFEVTDAMLESAIAAWFAVVEGIDPRTCEGVPVPPENLHDAMRAAITAAIEASGLLDLIAKADAVLDHADAHCRWFDISTAPKDGTIIQLGGGKFFCEARDCDISEPVSASWTEDFWLMGGTEGGYVCISYNDPTHWRPLPPLPTTPPLPSVFTDLGAALEKIKGAT